MTEETPAASRRFLRHREAGRRAGACRVARDVRARLHRLPAAQRLRPAAEHRRPLPQRRRHLHEPDPAGAADDHLRRRHADARVQLHRRRRADHRRCRSRSRAPGTRSSTSARTSRCRSTSWRASVARGDGRRAASSSTCRRGRKSCTRIRRMRRSAMSSASTPQTSLQDGLREMAAWVRRARRARDAAVRGHRDHEEPAAGRGATHERLVYHDVHLHGTSGARSGLAGRGASICRDGCRATAHVLEIGAGYCHWINAVGGPARRRRHLARLSRHRGARRRGPRPGRVAAT